MDLRYTAQLAHSPLTELFYDRGHHHEFLSLSQELAAPGELRQAQTFDFLFKNVEKQFESYQGINVKLRCVYLARPGRRVTLTTCLDTSFVYKYLGEWAASRKSAMSGCIRIECPPIVTTRSRWKSVLRTACTLNSSTTNPSKHRHFAVVPNFSPTLARYHLKDVIVGKIYFLLVRIKIKHMELSIIRRETTGSPPNQYNESETITKFEIMDGAPVRGKQYPVY